MSYISFISLQLFVCWFSPLIFCLTFSAADKLQHRRTNPAKVCITGISKSQIPQLQEKCHTCEQNFIKSKDNYLWFLKKHPHPTKKKVIFIGFTKKNPWLCFTKIFLKTVLKAKWIKTRKDKYLFNLVKHRYTIYLRVGQQALISVWNC